MPTTEDLLDEITIEKIEELKINSVCYQHSTRGIWPFKGGFHSTSFFIEKNILLTSGHNVVKTYRKVKKLKVSPSRTGNIFHYGTASINVNYSKNLRIYPDYKMKNVSTRPLYDIAIIYIPDSIISTNEKLAKLNYLPILEDISSLSIGETIYCAGYPASGKHKGRYRMTLDSSVISEIKDHSFTHKLDTRTGNSGSPIMVKRDEMFYVIGVNSINSNGTLICDTKKLWLEKSIKNLIKG